MAMQSAVLIVASLLVQAICLCAHLPIYFQPVLHAELSIWRQLRLAKLRKYLTKRLRKPESLDPAQTLRKAKRNIVWHAVMILALMPQSLSTLTSPSPFRLIMSIFLGCAAIAWLVGSLVQRQKLAILALSHAAKPGRDSG
jgi:hypothetical protein